MTVPRVLLDHRLHRPPAFGHVALEPADDTRVVVGIDEHLDVHERAQRRIREDENAFDDEGAARLDAVGHRHPGVAREVVNRRFHFAAVLERLHVPDEQVGLERIGVVVVERGALFEAQVVAIAIVAVVFEDADLVAAEAVDDAFDDRGLAGAGTAGDTNHDGGHRPAR